jgi:Neuraminidase (sialidase)
MVQYLQLERTTDGNINADANVVFNVELQKGGTQIDYNSGSGVITFTTVGVYYVNWFVAQQTGLATNGSNFAIKSATLEATGSNPIKISQTSGFAIIKVTAANQTAALVNVADAAAALSETALVKAGIAIFGVADSSGGSPTPGEPLGYIQAQVSNGPITLSHDEIVNFNHIITRDPNDIITQHNGNHRFILADPGTYLVSWEIPVMATEENASANVSLVLDGSVYSVSHMPLAVGMLSGSAMVVNTEPENELELINTSGDEMEIASLANIVIAQMSKLPPVM